MNIGKNQSMKYLFDLNINKDKLRFRDHACEELSFFIQKVHVTLNMNLALVGENYGGLLIALIMI